GPNTAMDSGLETAGRDTYPWMMLLISRHRVASLLPFGRCRFPIFSTCSSPRFSTKSTAACIDCFLSERLISFASGDVKPCARTNRPCGRSVIAIMIGDVDRKVQIIDRREVFNRRPFRIDEVRLQHECFDGSMSPVMSRLILDRGDSAAVLLHDPVRQL